MSNHRMDMEEAESYQRLFVAPMVQAVEAKLTHMLGPVIEANARLRTEVDAVKDRTTKLESSQKKALAGWGVFATGAATLMSFGWNWIRSHLHSG